MAQITREVKLDPSIVPPLDEGLLQLSESEAEFLHKAISHDDDELKAKILEVQKQAYKEHAYPCIRGFHFVNQFMAVNPIYPRVLEAGKSGNTVYLDLGCCMGTDVRRLVADGYPATNVLGCDLRQEFIDYGHTLYNDKDKCPIHFFASDIFEVPLLPASDVRISTTDIATVTQLSELHDTITHFYAGALFHLFDESTQYALALRVALLVKRQPGTIIFGRHQGLPEAGMIDDHLGRIRYGHSSESWPLLWKRVFSEIESPAFAEKVIVEAKLTEGFHKLVFQAKRQTQMLVWSVQIV